MLMNMLILNLNKLMMVEAVIFGVRQNKVLNFAVSVMHVDVRSLMKIFDNQEVLVLSLEAPPAIFCLTEIWLKDSDEPRSHLVHGYNQ